MLMLSCFNGSILTEKNSGKLCLRLSCHGQAQAVKSEVGIKVWLVMPVEQRLCTSDIGSFRKSLALPFVVLGDTVELER